MAGNLQGIQQLTAAGLLEHIMRSGDAKSVRDLLQKKNLEQPVMRAFRQMDLLQRNVDHNHGDYMSLTLFILLGPWRTPSTPSINEF